MLTSSLRHYSDTFVFLKATVTAKNTPAQGAAAYNINKKVIFKNCDPFTIDSFKIKEKITGQNKQK